uniref:AlNc14C98G5955 protein n=1 Tax=Albugo laibachii Nc14 TaxID=890382 RepID=F0WH90_9STRA|nr:AlNc14C98G5955 [Albugo laibachii Nc14]|eukprot:CCA20605.1 AlNc14C98G5955 [Albugo laibachii Nc14]
MDVMCTTQLMIKAQPSAQEDVYEYIFLPQHDKVQVSLQNKVNTYPETLELIAVMRTINVTPCLTSASQVQYLHPVLDVIKIGNKFENINGSTHVSEADMLKGRGFVNDGRGKVLTLSKIKETRNCVVVLGVGAPSGITEVLQRIVRDKGYAVILHKDNINKDRIKLANTHKSRVLLQKLTESSWAMKEATQ